MTIPGLAAESLFRRKKSSFLVFAVLLITFSAAIISLSLVSSISRTNSLFRQKAYGRWVFAIPSGMESDAAWLKAQPWCREYGIAHSYGTVTLPFETVGFGTIEDSLFGIEHLRLKSGDFPKQDNEAVLEETVLRSLGYDLTPGQEISLSVRVSFGKQSVPTEVTYILSGVLEDYSALWIWERNLDERRPISVMVTQSAAEAVVEQARALLLEDSLASSDEISPIPQYYLTVEPDERSTARDALNQYLKETRTGTFGDRLVCENTAAYAEESETSYNTLYIRLLSIITFAAILCVFILQLPDEVHRFAVLRSIGMTRYQLLLLIAAESLLPCVPAVLLGIPCGAGLTWLALKLLLYTGSAPIGIVIPYHLLWKVCIIWMLAVLTAKGILFCVILTTPLTGRIQLQNNRRRLFSLFRRFLILLLVGAFGVSGVFTVMLTRNPSRLCTYWSLCPYYTISAGQQQTVPVSVAQLLTTIPGISRVDGFGEMKVHLSFSGFEEQYVRLYAIDQNGWRESLDFDDCRETFESGEAILLCFPEVSTEHYEYPEDTVTLRFKRGGVCLAERTVKVCIREIPDGAMNRGLSGFWSPYTVFCSNTFLQSVIDSMPPGQKWGIYEAGTEYGYDRIYANTTLNADALSTDKALTHFCLTHGLLLDNRRPKFQTLVQENVQTLILTYASGISISLVILFILTATLSLETNQELIRFKILKILGMSKRQITLKILQNSLFRSLLSLLSGWLIYFIYIISTQTDSLRIQDIVSGLRLYFSHIGCSAYDFCIISSVSLILPLLLSLLMKNRLKKGGLAQ